MLLLGTEDRQKKDDSSGDMSSRMMMMMMMIMREEEGSMEQEEEEAGSMLRRCGLICFLDVIRGKATGGKELGGSGSYCLLFSEV